MDGAAGTGSVVLSVGAEVGEGGAELVLGRVGVRELRVRNDRGGDFEPRLESIGILDLLAVEPQVAVDGATPATYGRVTLRLGPDGWGHAAELQLLEAGRTIWVTIDAEVDVDVRCAGPAVLVPGGALRMSLTLDLGEIGDALEGRIPDEGDVRVDSDGDPDALDAVETALRTAWRLSCEGTSTESTHESS